MFRIVRSSHLHSLGVSKPTVSLLKQQRATLSNKEDPDPTPDKKRGGSDREATAGDAQGSSEPISQTDSAYDPNSTRPQESASKIEKESNKDMSRSAASKTPSKLATKGTKKD